MKHVRSSEVRTPKRKLTKADLAWIRGFAAALAEVMRISHEGMPTRHAMRGAGLTLDDLRSADVNSYDVDEIAKAFPVADDTQEGAS